MAHFDRAVSPGGEGKITLTVNLKRYHGQVWKSATIVSNDPEKPNVTLSFHGKIRPFIELLPTSSIEFRSKGPGQEEKTIDILATSHPFHIQKIENGLTEKIRYRLETVKDGQHYRLKITRLQKSGKFFGFIKCFTDHPQKPEIQIPIINNLDG
ncbi:MAG: hypothetical protein WA974_00360 [Thermodesulfobacteriota bacterium]